MSASRIFSAPERSLTAFGFRSLGVWSGAGPAFASRTRTCIFLSPFVSLIHQTVGARLSCCRCGNSGSRHGGPNHEGSPKRILVAHLSAPSAWAAFPSKGKPWLGVRAREPGHSLLL